MDIARYQQLAKEMDENLRMHVLAPRVPRAVDKEFGGFRQGFAEDWKPTGTGRDGVTQLMPRPSKRVNSLPVQLAVPRRLSPDATAPPI